MQTLLKNTQAYRLLKAEAEKNRLSHAYLLLYISKLLAKSFLHTDTKSLMMLLLWDLTELLRIHTSPLSLQPALKTLI